MIALHDCNGDVNRAINVLLEGSPDTVSLFLSELFVKDAVSETQYPFSVFFGGGGRVLPAVSWLYSFCGISVIIIFFSNIRTRGRWWGRRKVCRARRSPTSRRLERTAKRTGRKRRRMQRVGEGQLLAGPAVQSEGESVRLFT